MKLSEKMAIYKRNQKHIKDWKKSSFVYAGIINTKTGKTVIKKSEVKK